MRVFLLVFTLKKKFFFNIGFTVTVHRLKFWLHVLFISCIMGNVFICIMGNQLSFFGVDGNVSFFVILVFITFTPSGVKHVGKSVK